MSTYQSVQSNTGFTTVVITKPTSLAVGDLMLAGIWGSNDGSNNIVLDTPSGWTLEESVNISSNVSMLEVYSKIADSADVSASDFTFTSSTSTSASRHMIGHILRFTNYGLKAGEASGQTTGSGIASLSFAGFTPSYPDTTLVFFSGIDSSTSQYTTSTYAIATSNPTWTERAESSVNDATRDSALGVATAVRPEATATGNATASYSASADGMRGAGVIIALAPRVDGSTTVVTGNTYVVNHPFLRNGVTQIDGVDPDVMSRNTTQWTNTPKPTTVWTNTPKP